MSIEELARASSPVMNFYDIAGIVDRIRYKPGWLLMLISGPYLQVRLPPDRGGERWHGRKWMLSYHMTEGEIVQTALMACLAAEEHEAREAFTYKGHVLFGPHISIDRLLEVADDIQMRATLK